MRQSCSLGLATPRLDDQVRSVFVSDLHLGSKCCQAATLDFLLKRLSYERLYIVGDFFDNWLLPRRQPRQNLERLHPVVQTIRQAADRGAEVHYLLGNHDRELQPILENWGLTSLGESRVHECADGRRVLVIHGDQFDMMQHQFPRTARLAGHFHEALLRLSKSLTMRRSTSHRRFGTLATLPFKRLMQSYSRFDAGVQREIGRMGAQGIIFGHTHAPLLTEHRDGRLIVNTGDWLENCTVVLESLSGQLELWGGTPDDWLNRSPKRRALAVPQRLHPLGFEPSSPRGRSLAATSIRRTR